MNLEHGNNELKISNQAPIKKRGFAAMSRERQLEIASNGGKAAHAGGKANKFTSETGKAASLKAKKK